MAGPFYFAWVLPSETVFSVTAHSRMDEDIANFTIAQREGDFAVLTIDIRNPKKGLLNPSRKQWAWLAWDTGSAIQPLFFGRLVGVPSIKGELATIEFLARPSNFVSQKAALAATLRVAPYYDPVFIVGSKRADPDAVLETRGALWHINRTTGVVSVSDIVTGEDGTEVYTTAEVPYDSVQISMAQQPLMSVSVTASIGWTQSGASDPNSPIGRKYTFSARTHTGSSIVSNWPKVGTSIGDGWFVASASINTDYDLLVAGLQTFSAKSPDLSFPQGEDPTYTTSEVSYSNLVPTDEGGSPLPGWDDWISIITSLATKGGVDGASINESGYYVAAETINMSIGFGYNASRQRRETVTFTMFADVQAVQSPSNELDTLDIALSGIDVAAPVGEGTAVSITGTFSAGATASLYLLLADGREFTFTYTAVGGDTTDNHIAIGLANLVNASLAMQGAGVVAGTPSGGAFALVFPIGSVALLTPSGTGGLTVKAQTGEDPPLIDKGRRTYFPTARGIRSVEYLVMLARANLAMRARAVLIDFAVPMSRAVNLSCRKNAQLTDSRLPGGSAIGKIIEYKIHGDGDSGEILGEARMGCCVGHAGSVSAAAGTPDYVNTGYVTTGYQTYTGAVVLAGPGDVGYSPPHDYNGLDDGVTFPITQPIFISPPTYHSASAPALKSNMTVDEAKKAFAGHGDTFTVTMKPLNNGPYEIVYKLTTTTLVLPKGIDLEAA